MNPKRPRIGARKPGIPKDRLGEGAFAGGSSSSGGAARLAGGGAAFAARAAFGGGVAALGAGGAAFAGGGEGFAGGAAGFAGGFAAGAEGFAGGAAALAAGAAGLAGAAGFGGGGGAGAGASSSGPANTIPQLGHAFQSGSTGAPQFGQTYSSAPAPSATPLPLRFTDWTLFNASVGFYRTRAPQARRPARLTRACARACGRPSGPSGRRPACAIRTLSSARSCRSSWHRRGKVPRAAP